MVGQNDNLAELSDDLIATTAAIRRLTRRRLRTVLSEPRLRGAQVELLRVVAQEPGIGVAAVAKELHLAGNSTSTLVNQLVDSGMLLRELDPTDRRAVRLYLTEKAETRLRIWRQARIEIVEQGLTKLSPAERKQIAQALPALHTLLHNLAGGAGG